MTVPCSFKKMGVRQLNAKECYLIEALLKVKFKESEIANFLGRHVSTIYRLESLLKRKLILKLFLVVILKKYKTGLIIILENNYPRKLFNYKSAKDIFYENLNDCLKCCNRF